MMIPEDGVLARITSSNLNAFNNIMIVKLDDKSVTCGGTAFQLATLDRSKKGTVWPSDHYINKLIPYLPENKILDEQRKEFESRKELNLQSKTTTVRPKLIQQPDKLRYHFIGAGRSNLPRRKNLSDRSEKSNRRFLPKHEIDNIEPWVQNPWIKQPSLLPDPGNKGALLATPSNLNYNYPFVQGQGFYDFCPPADLNSVHLNSSSASSFQNHYPGYVRDNTPNFQSYNTNKFDDTPLAGSSKHYSGNNYRQNPVKNSTSSRRFKTNFPRNTSNRGSRHDSSTIERDNFEPNFTHEHGYSINDNIGRNLHISPNTHHKNYVPDSVYDPIPHSSFENKEIEDSVAYDGIGNKRNNSNNASYQKSYSRGRNNRKQHRWRNNKKFMHNTNPRANINSLNPQVNVNSLNPKINNSSITRGNMDSSTPRDKVDFFNSEENINSSSMSKGNMNFKFRSNRNSMQKFHPYNKNHRKHWMANKTSNFNKPEYNVNQKVRTS